MKLLNTILDEILVLRNADSGIKYNYEFLGERIEFNFITKFNESWLLRDSKSDKALVEFHELMHLDVVHALYYDEFGNFFTASWELSNEIKPHIPKLKNKATEDDKKNFLSELKALFEEFKNGGEFSKVYEYPFMYYKGFNISQSINFKELSSIEVKIIDYPPIEFKRNINDLMIFTQEDPISYNRVWNIKLVISESGDVFNRSKETKELKVDTINTVDVIFNLSDNDFPLLELRFINMLDLACYLLNFLAKFEISTREKSKNYMDSFPEIEDLENNSLFPAPNLRQTEVFSYDRLLKKYGYDRDYFFKQYERIISSREAILKNDKFILHSDIAQYFTIIETDKILIEKGMRNYSLYEVSRSTHSSIGLGEYFYAFDASDNLLLLKPPYRHVLTDTGNYIVFDSELYQRNEVIVIPKSEIVSYKLYGTELMQSSVKTNQQVNVVEVKTDSPTPQYRSPSIIGTALSGFLFGSAYTILNGVGKAMHQQTNVLGNKLDNLGDKLDDVVQAINSISISTDHQIIDTSRVQIVLSNRRDLEIDGVNIYYDLNRVYPNLSSDGSLKQSQSESTSSATTTMTDEIMKLKKMLDEGIIDEDEFKLMKKKILK